MPRRTGERPARASPSLPHRAAAPRACAAGDLSALVGGDAVEHAWRCPRSTPPRAWRASRARDPSSIALLRQPNAFAQRRHLLRRQSTQPPHSNKRCRDRRRLRRPAAARSPPRSSRHRRRTERVQPVRRQSGIRRRDREALDLAVIEFRDMAGSRDGQFVEPIAAMHDPSAFGAQRVQHVRQRLKPLVAKTRRPTAASPAPDCTAGPAD